MSRMKWWKLKECQHKLSRRGFLISLNEGPWYEGGDANMWMKMTTYIRKVISEELGVTKEGNRKAIETTTTTTTIKLFIPK
jgi:hypothetical protein